MSTFESLDREVTAFSHDSSYEPIPTVDEILSGLSELRGDIGHLSDLKSEEDRAVEGLFQTLKKLTQLLQWAEVETSVLPVELGEVESAKVTPEGALIYCLIDGEIGTLDLSDYDNRDVLVEVVQDLVPKLREILENPPEVKEPVIEEPEPEPEPELELVEEELVLEELAVEELDVVEEAEEPVTEPAIEEPVAEEEPEEHIIEEPSEPPTLESLFIEEAVKEKPPVQKEELEPQKTEPKDRKVELLWAILKGRRVDSLKEILDYRARREEEDRKVMEALRKGKGHGLLEDRSFFKRLKDIFFRRRKKR